MRQIKRFADRKGRSVLVDPAFVIAVEPSPFHEAVSVIHLISGRTVEVEGSVDAVGLMLFKAKGKEEG